MESLAQFLGLTNTLAGEDLPDAPPAPDVARLSGSAFCRALVESREYRMALLARVSAGSLPPAVECRILDHAWGKTPMRLEVDDQSLESLTPERVREKLSRTQRLLQLLEAAQTEDMFHTPVDGAVH